jgi:RNA-binding protein
MKALTSSQAKYLRGRAHAIKPVVFVGQKGLTEALIKSAGEALYRHEVIKIRFIDFKEKEQKIEIAAALEKKTGSRMAGMIGHTAIFYKPHSDPAKRKIILPE